MKLFKENKLRLNYFIKKLLPKLTVFIVGANCVNLLIVKPLLSFILDFFLRISGYQIAFNQSILSFFLTWEGMVGGILVLTLASLVAYYEFAVVITCAWNAKNDQEFSLQKALKQALHTLTKLVNISMVGLFVYLFGLLTISGLGLNTTLLPKVQVPNFITGELAKNSWGEPLILAVYGLLGLLFFLSIYTVPIMVLEDVSFFKGLKRSVLQIFKNWKRAFLLIVCYIGIVAITTWLPEYVFRTILNSSTISFASIFRTYNSSIEGFVLVLLTILYYVGQILLMPLLLSMIVFYYREPVGEQSTIMSLEKEQRVDYQIEKVKNRALTIHKKHKSNWKYKGFIYAITIGIILSMSLQIYRMVEHAPGLHPPIVIGHRGSVEGVENTLEAIQGAIDVEAEYAEIDILLSADGVPMVIHDDNLQRLAGIGKNVHDLSAAELGEITLTQNEKTGKISTLEEVVVYTEGKIGLAVELKTHGFEKKNLVDEVSSILIKYNRLESDIFLSMDYDLIDEMNKKHPKATAGLCMFGNIGDFKPKLVKTMNIDFVVIEEWLVNEKNVKNFREAWLPVYVWTVNEEVNMDKYLLMGVLGLVSDYPDQGKRSVKNYLEKNNPNYLDEADWKESY